MAGEIIPFAEQQVGAKTVHTVNARDLYAYLELSGDYSLWIRRALKRANLLENRDFVVYYQVVENPKGGRPAAEHHLTFDAAKHVAMMSSATKGNEVREYFIAKEKELLALQAESEHPLVAQAKANLQLTQRFVRVEQELAEAKIAQARIETKADLALEDAHYMTIEEFIGKNGLLRQFPEPTWLSWAKWLAGFCREHGLTVRKVPVPGKSWPDENVYPITALMACQRAMVRKRGQGELSIVGG